MSQQPEAVSIRGLARQLGVTHEAVRRALKTGRLHASVRDGRIVDAALAAQEWPAGASRVRVLNRREKPTTPAAAAVEAVDPKRLSVVRDGELIVLAWQRYEDDIDGWFVVPMTNDTARQLARRLIAACDGGPTNRRQT